MAMNFSECSGKFGENEADLVFHDDVHGSLIEQAERTLVLIYFKHLKAKISYDDGLRRVEKIPFSLRCRKMGLSNIAAAEKTGGYHCKQGLSK